MIEFLLCVTVPLLVIPIMKLFAWAILSCSDTGYNTDPLFKGEA